MNLAPHWTEPESENVLTVHVQRYKGKGSTILGRIDTKEHIYHARHHDIADFVRWSDRTVTMSIEELRECAKHGVLWVEYFDETHSVGYTISLDRIRTTGEPKEREQIGLRWCVPFDEWERREAIT